MGANSAYEQRLPRSAEALAHAGRMLAELEGEVHTGGTRFRDRLPYVLDLLAGVTRTIDQESKGQRSDAFRTWWNLSERTLRDEIQALRNAELKARQQSTAADFTIVVHESLNTGPSGTTGVTPTSFRAEYRFDGGAFDGQEVVAVLRRYMTHLIEVLDTAEQKLRE